MKSMCSILVLILLRSIATAQDIESTLSGNTATQGFTVKKNNGETLFTVRGDGAVGVTGYRPGAMLFSKSSGTGLAALFEGRTQVAGVDGFLVTGTHDVGTIPATGAGTRMMFYSKKGAFRAGRSFGSEWDETSIGNYSTAVGSGTTASGEGSTAMGGGTVSRGFFSTAMGFSTKAEAYICTAIGSFNVGGGDATIWIATDPLFEIGNSRLGRPRSNAVTVYKNASAAIGPGSTATGQPSWSMGDSAAASANYAVALGRGSTASGAQAIAMGWNTTSSGTTSTAMGNGTTASGDNSLAAGIAARASGWASMALGANVTASGDRSIALGSSASTEGQGGSCLVGDNSTTTNLTADSPNRFRARFANGYDLYTNSGMNLGVSLGANAASWSVVSDSTRKNSYRAADSEEMLSRFASLRLGSWKYTADPHPNTRHYGPMAQEWFAAFGYDGIGVIGNDTSLASADVDGVLCIAVQALEKRTAELKEATSRIAALEREVQELRKLSRSVDILRAELAAMRAESRRASESVHAGLTEK